MGMGWLPTSPSDLCLRLCIIKHMIQRWKGLGKLYSTDLMGMLSDLTGSRNQDGGFQTRTKSDTDISACKQNRNEISTVKPIFLRSSYTMGVVVIFFDQTGSKKSKMAAKVEV